MCNNMALSRTGDDAARAVAAGAGGGFSSTMHAAAESAFLNTVFSEAGPESRAAQVNIIAIVVNECCTQDASVLLEVISKSAEQV